MDEHSDEVSFIPELVEVSMYEIIENTLKNQVFNELLVQDWVDEICGKITKELVESNKPFKYIVSATVMQKNGAGLHLGHSCFWDAGNDNVVIARWPNEKKKDPNARVVCIVTVYGVAF